MEEVHLNPLDDQLKFSLTTEKKKKTFYEIHIKPRLEKGFMSNFLTFVLMLVGILFRIVAPNFIFGQFVLYFGLFGFSGGFTNWIAIKMLFDRIPLLYGSGVIPRRFVEIRETVKNVVLSTFFDPVYLENYLHQKSGQLIEGLKMDEKIKEILESKAIDDILDKQLGELITRPEGALLAMMGLNAQTLKPMVKPFVMGMGMDFIPLLTKNFDPSKMINIDKIRTEVDGLMSTKLLELTPEKVKELIADVIREHLGWLIVWGNVFGGLIGIVSKAAEIIF